MRPVTRPGSSRSSGHLHALPSTQATTTAPHEAVSEAVGETQWFRVLGTVAVASNVGLIANILYMVAFR